MRRSVSLLLALAACAPPAEQERAGNNVLNGETVVTPAEAPDQPMPENHATPSPRPTEDNRSTARYRCMDGSRLVANFDPDNRRVTVSRGGKALATLRGERVASGILYAADGYELRAKGLDMTFTEPGLPPIACTIIR